MSQSFPRGRALRATWRLGMVSTSLLWWGGCFAGSLASTTGPGGGEWSVAQHQQVHVGETVRFSFVLKKPLAQHGIHAEGIADYCVFMIGDDRLETEVNDLGTFRVAYTFDRIQPGNSIRVKATAYRQYGVRDYMKIHGEWLKNESPNNARDQALASASLRLTAYQSRVELTLPPSADDYDMSTGRLVLRPRSDVLVPVYRSDGGRGFEAGPTPAGGWTVTYLPGGDEVSPHGVTQVEFSVYDRAGRERMFKDTLETP